MFRLYVILCHDRLRRRRTASVMAVTSTRSRTAVSSSSTAVFPLEEEDPSSSTAVLISPNSSRPDVTVGPSGPTGPSGRHRSPLSTGPSSSILVPEVDGLDVVVELVPASPSPLVGTAACCPLRRSAANRLDISMSPFDSQNGTNLPFVSLTASVGRHSAGPDDSSESPTAPKPISKIRCSGPSSHVYLRCLAP